MLRVTKSEYERRKLYNYIEILCEYEFCVEKSNWEVNERYPMRDKFLSLSTYIGEKIEKRG